MSAIRGIDGFGVRAEGLASPELREPALGGVEGSGTPDLEPGGATAAPSFSDVLGNLVLHASTASRDAAEKADLLARGATDDLHGTMIAAKEAEISVKLVGSIRNKLIDAFQELWRTNV